MNHIADAAIFWPFFFLTINIGRTKFCGKLNPMKLFLQVSDSKTSAQKSVAY